MSISRSRSSMRTLIVVESFKARFRAWRSMRTRRSAGSRTLTGDGAFIVKNTIWLALPYGHSAKHGPQAQEQHASGHGGKNRSGERRSEPVRPRITSPSRHQRAHHQKTKTDDEHRDEEVVDQHHGSSTEDGRIWRADECAQRFALNEQRKGEAPHRHYRAQESSDPAPQSSSPPTGAREAVDRKLRCMRV